MPLEMEMARSKQLNEVEKRLLAERLKALDSMLAAFPESPVNELPDHQLLNKAEAWARAATIDIYNTFNMLAEIPYRTRQMDAAADNVRRAFHAAFELMFSTRREPRAADFLRARTAVKMALESCNRLI